PHLLLRPPRRSTLFPYTTLFRSEADGGPVRIGDEPRQLDARFGVDPEPPPFVELELSPFLRTERFQEIAAAAVDLGGVPPVRHVDRKSTRLNSSHVKISYAVFCL